MARGTETTTKIKVDVSQLKQSLREANQSIALTNSRFKEATAGMEDWTKSADGLTAKINQLENVNKDYQKILDDVADRYKEVVEAEGENSESARALEIKMNSLKSAIKGNETAIKKYQDNLSDIDTESKDAEKGLEKVAKEIKETGEQAEKSGGKLKGFLGSIGKGVIGGIGSAVTGLAGGLMMASESSKEFNDNMAKLSTTATDSGYSTEFAKKSFEEMYGVLGDETASNTTVSNFMAMETSQENLNSLLNSSAGIWAKYGDSIPLDGLAESVNETAKVGAVTGGLADALNWAGISEDEFNEKLSNCTSEQERQQLIVDTLNSEYGELGEQYKKSNSAVIDLNKAQLEMKNSIAQIGTAFTPVLAMFTQFGSGLLSSIVPDVQSLGSAFTDMLNGVDGAEEKIGGAVSNILTTLTTTITSMLPKVVEIGVQIITSLISGLSDGKTLNSIFNAITQIITTLANGIVQLAPQLLELVVKIVYQVIDKLVQLAPELLNSAIQLFQGLIDALMKLDLVTLLAELIVTLIYTLIDAVPQLLDGAVKLFTSLLDALTEIIPQLLNMLPYVIQDLTKFLVSAIPQLSEACITMFMALVDAVPVIIEELVKALPDIITSLIDFLLQSIPVLLDASIQMFMALIKAIPTICKELLKAVPKIIVAIFQGLKDLPSKLREFFVNIWSSIKDVFSGVKDYFGDKFQEAVDTIKNVFDEVGDFFGNLWDTLKTKVSDIGGKIGDTVGQGIKAGVNGMISFVETTLNKIPDIINGAIEMINEIPGIDIGWRMSDFTLPRLAKGGVVDRPTLAEIGENGREAVIPLENNLGWIKSLAGKLATELKTVNNSCINNMAQNVVNNFYQTNNSPKALSRLDIYRQSKNLLSMKGV
jgi:phage-related protein